jgi:hypothetical protein
MNAGGFRAVGLALVLGAVGCGPGHLSVRVNAPPGANQGRPLQMVVRAVDAKQYLTESYADVAKQVVHPDDSVVETLVVYPGTRTETRVKVPEDASLAVSFLFTTPDGAWQVLLDAPFPGKVDIELEESRIRTDVARRPTRKGGGAKTAEAPKAEAPKVEAPKVEAPKVEAKVEAKAP